jgi:hypothetical protein
MKRRVVLALAVAGLAWAQNPPAYQQFPDCNVALTLNDAILNSPTFDNRQVGCTYWVLVYGYDNGPVGNFTITLQSAPTVAGAPGVWVTFDGQVVSGLNPNTFSGGSYQFQAGGLQPWVRVLATPIGLGQTIKGFLYGWKTRPGAGSGAPVTAFIGDGANLDAFSRLRTSNSVTLFDSQQEYGLNPYLWETVTANGGTVAYTANLTSSVLTVTGVNASRALATSRQYVRYQPGKSQLIIMTGVLGTAGDNNSRRIGQYDGANGLFFQSSQTGVSVVQRSTVAAVFTELVTGQASWNIDKFDGTGPSGITLDVTKTQIFVIDYQWLGSGRVRFGLDVEGRIFYCHQIFHANVNSNVYIAAANLPLRAENVNTAVSTLGTQMQFVCATAISEGGFETERGYVFSASNGNATLATTGTALRPALCIRPRLLFNTKPNRGSVVIEDAGVTSGGNLYWGLAYYSAPTGGTFQPVNANSIVETDGQSVAATVLSTGFGSMGTIAYQAIGGGALATNRETIVTAVVSKYPITIDSAAAVADNVCIFVQSLTGNVNFSAWMVWRELY